MWFQTQMHFSFALDRRLSSNKKEKRKKTRVFTIIIIVLKFLANTVKCKAKNKSLFTYGINITLQN